MAIELVSYADLKNLLELDQAAISDYPALNVLRDSVTSAFEVYTGRLFTSEARTKTIYIDSPTQMLSLEGIPVASVSSLTVTVSETTETYTEHDDYEIRAYGLKLLSSVQDCTVAITYTGGLSATTDSLSRAALLQVAYEFQAKDQIGADSVSTEGGTISRPALGLLKEVKRLLNLSMHPLRW